MRKFSAIAAVTVAAVGVVATSCDSKKSVKLTTDMDSVSYAIGVTTGASYKENIKTIPGGEANVDALIAGFTEALKGEKTSMTPEEAQAFMQTYFVQAAQKEADETKAAGVKFLDENKGKPGVITTESGLQYKVETEGKGARPKATDKVKVHYTGKLLDGTVFDSSVERGEPAVFGVDQVIPGWTEALQLMPVGSKYILWIPSELAYGERGAGRDIKPNSTLQFEVELIDIEK